MALTADKIRTCNGVTVNEYILSEHNPIKILLPYKRYKQLIGVTIHNTNDLVHVEDDGEQYTRATINGNMGSVRVHYYVDDICAWQNLDESYMNWTCADGNGPGNTQTIAIESIMDGTNSEQDKKAFDNTARLAAYILYKNNLKSDQLFTHTYWLHIKDHHIGTVDELNVKPHPYKTCPYYIIPKWDEFKKLVKQYYDSLCGYETFVSEDVKPVAKDTSFLVKIKSQNLNVRNGPGLINDAVSLVYKDEVYTIVDTTKVGNVTWGKLKSGAGWISLYPTYVERV